MKKMIRSITAIAGAALIALPGAAWAAHGGGHSGRSHSGQGHHHHGHGGVFVGAVLFYPWPYSYGFYPPWDDLERVGPVVYVEQFTGTPTSEMKDWIYCPAKAASYPEVTECPRGWQRVTPLGQAMEQYVTPERRAVTP